MTRHNVIREPGLPWQELRPTGKFVFTIDEHLGRNSRNRRVWSDTANNQLEQLIPTIIEGLLLVVPILIERERKEKDHAAERGMEARRLREEEDRKRLDDARWATFLELAQRFDTVARLERFILALQAEPIDPFAIAADQSVSEWISWATRRLKTLDPLAHGALGIFREVSNTPK